MNQAAPPTISIALLGDYQPGYLPHERAMTSLTESWPSVSCTWVPTADLVADAEVVLAGYSGIWAGSGPYRNKAGILNGIRFAREQNLPFLGTCSGFGYTVLEFAQSQFGLTEVYHPAEGVLLEAEQLFLHPLAVCGIGTHEITVRPLPNTLAHRLYQTEEPVQEWSNCSYGIHPEQIERFAKLGLRVAADDETGEAKLLELSQNSLFLAMLYYPQLNATPAHPHPILTAFVEQASRYSSVSNSY